MAKIGINMATCKIRLISKHSFELCSYSLGSFETKLISNYFSPVQKFKCAFLIEEKIGLNMEPDIIGMMSKFFFEAY